jgi:hypothetical protein
MVINLCVAGILLYYLMILWKFYPFSIGGTLVFASFIGIANYYSIKIRIFAFELSLFSLIPLLLMGLNFIAYIENRNGFSIAVIIGAVACTLLIHWLILFLVKRPFCLKEKNRLLEVKIDFVKKIAYLFAQSIMILIPFLLATVAIFMVMKDTNNIIFEKRFLNFTSFCLFWLLISLMYNLLVLKKNRKYVDQSFVKTVLKKAEVSTKFFKLIPIVIITTLIIGSGFEIQRGYWLLWVISYLTFLVLIIFEWGTWRFVFLNVNQGMPIVSVEETDTIMSGGFITNSNISIKKIVILFLVLLIYIFLLLILSSYFRNL